MSENETGGQPECTCYWTDPSTWTTYYGATEPGSQREQNPDCAVHGERQPDKGMTPVTYWTVKCATCGRDAFEGTDHTAWSDQEGASMTAADYYYELVDGSWYCEEHTPDDEAGDPR